MRWFIRKTVENPLTVGACLQANGELDEDL